MSVFEITFYSQETGAEIGAELVNVENEHAASQWAFEAVGDDGDQICWSVEEINKEG